MPTNYVERQDNMWDQGGIDRLPKAKPEFVMYGLNEADAIDIHISLIYEYYASRIASAWIDEVHPEHNLLVAEQVSVWDNIIEDLKSLDAGLPQELVEQAILELQARREELLM